MSEKRYIITESQLADAEYYGVIVTKEISKIRNQPYVDELEELEKTVDEAISKLYTGTEEVVSAHARHKALAWVKMKIKELRKKEGR